MPSEIRLHNIPTPDVDRTVDTPVQDSHVTGSPVPAAAHRMTDTGSPLTDFMHLPQLPAPSSALNLEVLMDSLNFEGRRDAIKQGIASIEINAQRQKALTADVVSKMKDNLAKMEEAKKLADLMKILGVIALVVAVVVTVATLGTAGPVIAGISLLLMGNTLLSHFTDGKQGIAAWVGNLCEACGMDAEVAHWVGVGFEIAISIALIAGSIGAALSKASSKASAGTVEKLAQGAAATAKGAATELPEQAAAQIAKSMASYSAQITKNSIKLSSSIVQASAIAKEAAKVSVEESFRYGSSILNQTLARLMSPAMRTAANLARFGGTAVGGVNGAILGVVTITHGEAEAEATDKQAGARRLEAVLTRLREFTEMERAFMKAEMERTTALMDSVIRIVHNKNDALERIASTAHVMA